MSANFEIQQLIYSSFLTNEDLNSIIDAVKMKRAQLGRQIKRTLSVGDNVEFTSSKTGRLTRGHVTKIAIKYVTVGTSMGAWRVPANMLTLVENVTV